MPLWNIDPNAHCYFWVTNNFLESGLFVLRAIGFRYITNLAWTKNKSGLGQYFRGWLEVIHGYCGAGWALRETALLRTRLP